MPINTVERRSPLALNRLTTAALTGLLLLAGCSDATEPRVARALEVVVGEEQVIEIGAESDPLVVRVLDQFDSALGGVLVEWSVAAGEGSLSDLSRVTTSDGQAQVTYIAGDSPGETEVRASVAGLDPVTFFLTVSSEVDAEGEA